MREWCRCSFTSPPSSGAFDVWCGELTLPVQRSGGEGWGAPCGWWAMTHAHPRTAHISACPPPPAAAPPTSPTHLRDGASRGVPRGVPRRVTCIGACPHIPTSDVADNPSRLGTGLAPPNRRAQWGARMNHAGARAPPPQATPGRDASVGRPCNAAGSARGHTWRGASVAPRTSAGAWAPLPLPNYILYHRGGTPTHLTRRSCAASPPQGGDEGQ